MYTWHGSNQDKRQSLWWRLTKQILTAPFVAVAVLCLWIGVLVISWFWEHFDE